MVVWISHVSNEQRLVVITQLADASEHNLIHRDQRCESL
jgi:hypothetical protein